MDSSAVPSLYFTFIPYSYGINLPSMHTLFSNGKFYLGRGQWAQAVLVGDNGVITDVFIRPPDPLLLKKSDIQQVNLGGYFVFPAFEDAHNHPAARARTLYELDFRKKDISWHEVKKMMEEKAAETWPNQWIVCHGWSDARWGTITQDELDRISSDHGVMLVHVSYHGALMNKKALAMLKEKGASLRHQTAQETGRVTEENFDEAMVATAGTAEQYQHAIPAFARMLLSKGIVTTHDMNITTFAQLDAYAQLARSHTLPISITLYLNPRLLNDPEKIAPYIKNMSGDISIAGLKLFLDGAIGTSTAAVSHPYHDDTGSGTLRMDFSACAALIKKGASLGLRHIAMHCIGDRAVDLAVGIFERLQDEYRHDITTWRFEHFEVPSERAIRALADRGGIASMQPNFNWDVAHYYNRLGNDVKRINPFRHIQDAGVTLAFGSDDMPSGPVEGIHWATTDAPYNNQRLTLDEAIDAYTTAPARILGMDRVRGKIAKGYEANFAIFEKNPFNTASDAKEYLPKEVWRRGAKLIG